MTREAIVVAAGVLLVAVVASWPVVIAPNAWMVGPSYNDHASIAWTFDLVADWLAAGHAPWGHTDRVEFPTGAVLWPADLPEAVAVAPVTAMVGAMAAVNLLSLVHPALAAGITYGWLRREGCAAWPSVGGALGFALHGSLLAGTFNGNPDVTPLFWVPAAAWLASAPGPKRAALAGLAAGAAGWFGPYAGVMAVFAGAIRIAGDRRWRDLAVFLVPAGILGAAMVGVVGATLDDAGRAITKGHRVDLMGTAPLASLVWPPPSVLSTDPYWTGPHVATSGYLGWSLLVPALWLGRRAPRWAWALVALGVIAGLGPELKLVEPGPAPFGTVVREGTGIPLPWALVERLPGLGELLLTSRYTGLCALGLARIAAEAVPASRGVWWSALVAFDLLVLADGRRAFEAAPVVDDGLCAAIAPLAPGAVVDAPPNRHELGMYASICHGRPVAEGINRPLGRDARRALDRGPAEGPARLRKLGYRWFVVHHPPGVALGPGGFDDVIARLAGCKTLETPGVTIYDLECP